MAFTDYIFVDKLYISEIRDNQNAYHIMLDLINNRLLPISPAI